MAKMLKKYKVGLDSETYAISLVEEPAIEVDFVALEKEEQKVELFQSEERHICYGPALLPDKDIYRISEDGTEYYLSFTKESISKMSQEFMKEYRQHNVTLDHQDDANEVYIVESWLVEDPFKDKAKALGFDVPAGTWMVGMKVNNIETWERVKDGSLKGFSVESMISLEDFNKIQNKDNMIELNDEMSFWSKMKEMLVEAFTSSQKKEELASVSGMTVDEFEKESETIKEELKEIFHTEEPVEAPVVEAPVETPDVVEEPKVEEPKVEDTVDTKVEEDVNPNPYEELLKNLNAEIEALRNEVNRLGDENKKMSAQPSVKPISTNGKHGDGSMDTYTQWRSQMAKYM